MILFTYCVENTFLVLNTMFLCGYDVHKKYSVQLRDGMVRLYTEYKDASQCLMTFKIRFNRFAPLTPSYDLLLYDVQWLLSIIVFSASWSIYVRLSFRFICADISTTL